MSKIKIELPKVIEVTTNNGDKINVKPFLTTAQLSTIIEQAKVVEDYLDRKNIIDVLIVRFCSDIDDLDVDNLDTSILDVYRANGIIDLVISNINKEYIDIIYKSVEEYRNVRNTILEMSESIGNMIKDFDVNDMLENINNMKEVLKNANI